MKTLEYKPHFISREDMGPERSKNTEQGRIKGINSLNSQMETDGLLWKKHFQILESLNN